MLNNLPANKALLPEHLQPLQQMAVQLQTMQWQTQEYAVKLSQGDLDAEPPPRKNYLAAGLKQLQAQMRHLTWQAQCVARGDYNQQVDFMGEFSEAFNQMVGQLKDRETSLHEQREALIRIFDRMDSAVLVAGESDDEILFANKFAHKRFQIGSEQNDPFLQAILKIHAGENESDHEIRQSDANRWYGVTSCRLHWGDQAAARLYYCIDITTHKQTEENLKLQANTDALTGLRNRRAFDAFFAQKWEQCLLAEKPITLMVFDIDHFKKYNDAYGHLQGDVCLAHFAGVLQQIIKRSEDIVARYGGEEFVAVLPFTSLENGLQIAEQVRRQVENEVILHEEDGADPVKTKITVSIGVSSVVPRADLSPDRLVRAADNALYESKEKGRNRVYSQQILCSKEDTKKG